jgi:NAD(P)-dependent dehydrogenase (short-subunit alcohol dehydrogenase family)
VSSGRSVLVTGTSTGIGEACVRRFAAEGWTVFAGVRRPEDGERVRSGAGGDVRPVLLDVTDPTQVAAAVTEVAAATGGRLHGLVNNAGIGAGGPVEVLPDEGWRTTFDVNLFGPLALTRAAFPLVAAASGRFVFVGSVAGRTSAPTMAAYAASKHALEAVAESMRHELAATSMRVSLIEPGEVRTAIWDKADAEIDRLAAMLEGDTERRYGRFVTMMRGFVEEGRSKGADPADVADSVMHALTARRPRARYLVGPGVRVTALVCALPDPLRDRLTAAQLRRWERDGSTPRARP